LCAEQQLLVRVTRGGGWHVGKARPEFGAAPEGNKGNGLLSVQLPPGDGAQSVPRSRSEGHKIK
jgi:hypothetical protein